MAGVPSRASSFARQATTYSLAVTAASLPLYVARWRVGPVPTTLLELLIGITVLCYAATLIAERRAPAARTPYDILVVLVLVAGAAGIVGAPNRITALGIYRAYFVEPVVLFYVAVDVLRSRSAVVAVLLGGATGASIMAVGQIVSFSYALTTGQLKLGDAPAFLNTSPNAVALYLEAPIGFALAFAVHPSARRERWIAAGVLALLLLADVMTLSRGSYLALAVLAAVTIGSLRSNRWRLRAFAVVLVAGLITIEIPLINQRLLDLAHSAFNRSSLYRQAIEMLSQRPIFGAGISGYPIRVAPFRPPRQTIQLYPHDFWLTTWSEIGLLGVIAMTVLIVAVVWLSTQALRLALGLSRPLLWGSINGLVLFAVHGLFDSPYWKNDLSAEFWLVIALQAVALRSVRAGQPATAGAPTPSPAS